jgi:hypothetical protein
MKFLAFRNGALAFEERSLLAVSAACLVANGVRERLTELFDASVALKLFEPVIPNAAGWAAIGAGALHYRIRGTLADAALIVREADASVLAAAAFGERTRGGEQLSAIERTVLERTMRAIAQYCAPVCGGGALNAEQGGTLVGFTTYFELQIEAPVRARIGVALSREPVVEARAGFNVEDLYDVRLPLRARVTLNAICGDALAALRPGTVLALPPGPPRAVVTVAGRPLGAGEWGVHGRYYAVAVDRVPTGKGESAR